MKIYKWREGSRYSGNVEAVGLFLEEKFRNKALTVNNLVQEASDKKSPVHRYFTWDDKEAADLYRLEEARHLINSLVVQIDGEELPAYESIKFENKDYREYISTEEIKNAPDLVTQVLEAAKRDLVFWRRKYSKYENYFALTFKAIDQEVNESWQKQKNRKQSKSHQSNLK